MILVDTSVWVDHLREAEAHLLEILSVGKVLMHAMIVGEIACGNLANRAQVLRNMKSLSAINELEHGDVLSMIEAKGLTGRGIGFVDAHLACAVLNREGAVLWTRDRRLREIAGNLGIAYGRGA